MAYLPGQGKKKTDDRKTAEKTSQTASINPIDQKYAEELSKDTDGDGLKDWEEVLWKTDINNKDTDGDGTNDNEEIRRKRNPAVKGPDDAMLDTVYKSASKGENGEEIENLTTVYASEMLRNIIMTKAENGSFSTEDSIDVAKSIMSSLDDFSGPEEYIYQESELATTSDKSEKTLKEYANKLCLIIQKYFDPIPESEMAVLEDMMINKNYEKAGDLEALVAAYQNTAEEALKITVPEELVSEHLNIINTFALISRNIKRMAKIETDPAMSLIGMRQYSQNAQTANTALRSLYETFAKKSIIFGEKEAGNYLKNYEAKKQTI